MTVSSLTRMFPSSEQLQQHKKKVNTRFVKVFKVSLYGKKKTNFSLFPLFPSAYDCPDHVLADRHSKEALRLCFDGPSEPIFPTLFLLSFFSLTSPITSVLSPPLLVYLALSSTSTAYKPCPITAACRTRKSSTVLRPWTAIWTRQRRRRSCATPRGRFTACAPFSSRRRRPRSGSRPSPISTDSTSTTL